jgi:fatty acid desaturase
MERKRMHYPLRYRRARSLLWVIGLFWLWLWLGSAALIGALHDSPVHAVLATYALAVVVLVSIPAALLAAIRMVLTHPRRGGVVVPLNPGQPGDSAHWWYGEKAS